MAFQMDICCKIPTSLKQIFLIFYIKCANESVLFDMK